jgi:hypothetical protein
MMTEDDSLEFNEIVGTEPSRTCPAIHVQWGSVTLSPYGKEVIKTCTPDHSNQQQRICGKPAKAWLSPIQRWICKECYGIFHGYKEDKGIFHGYKEDKGIFNV